MALLVSPVRAWADDAKPVAPTSERAKPGGPTLGVGDPAPPLKIGKWLQGEPAPSFSPDKVYVVEFWATWCGPCLAAMPHLDRLARKYDSAGLVVLAVTGKSLCPADDATTFVKSTGKDYAFRFGYCEDDAADRAYMVAAGQEGIPCSFVIGKDGKIAFIGHPTELDDVLPLVVAGKWRGRADVEELAKVSEAMDRTIPKLLTSDPADALARLDKIATRFSATAAGGQAAAFRVTALFRLKRPAEAEAVAAAAIKRLTAEKDADGLLSVCAVWLDQKVNADQRNVALGLEAVDAAVAAGGFDANTYIEAAGVCFVAGRRSKAVELAEKAVAAAEQPETKAFMTHLLERYKGKPDTEKKAPRKKPTADGS